MILCDPEGIPKHVQKVTIWHDKVLFTVCTGHRYWRTIASLNPDYKQVREECESPMDFIAYLSDLLEEYVNSELGLFYSFPAEMINE